MVNIKLIIDAIAIPFGVICTILIFSRNRRNIVNILLGLITFLGGVLAISFSLLKEIYFPINYNLALIFAKLTYLCTILMTIPTLSFSILFWRASTKNTPWFLHIFAFIPAIFLGVWLFLDVNSI
ncbi:MAG: hypothetical protein ACFFDW_10925, partial [Candidatus Thorarchaeota archaeon]